MTNERVWPKEPFSQWSLQDRYDYMSGLVEHGTIECNRLQAEIERLQTENTNLRSVIDSRNRALGFVQLPDEPTAPHDSATKRWLQRFATAEWFCLCGLPLDSKDDVCICGGGVTESAPVDPAAWSTLKSSGEWRLGPNTINPHCHCVITSTFVDSSKCPVHGLPQRTSER